MPPTTINRRPAQKPGKGIVPGKNKQAKRRPGSNRAGKANTGIIANSIFALTLQPKLYLQVQQANGVKSKNTRYGNLWDRTEDDYLVMYNDILLIVQRSIKLVTNETTTFNPLLEGFDLSESFDFVLRMFVTNVLPNEWEYNIEKGQDGYHLVIYKACEFQAFWLCFEFKPAAEYLYKKNLVLHDMYIRFMKSFCVHLGIDAWYNGWLGYVEYEMLEEHSENYEWDSLAEEEDAKKDIAETIACYKTGDAHWYEMALKQALVLPVYELRKRLKAFAKNNLLVKWMLSACDFIDLNFKVNNFIYPELVEEMGEGLMFDLQQALIWNSKDRMTYEQEQYLDAESQGYGIYDPILHFRIYKDCNSIDLDKLKTGLNWPVQLTKLFHQYNEAIKVYE